MVMEKSRAERWCREVGEGGASAPCAQSRGPQPRAGILFPLLFLFFPSCVLLLPFSSSSFAQVREATHVIRGTCYKCPRRGIECNQETGG